jgi:hypothetical protein
VGLGVTAWPGSGASDLNQSETSRQASMQYTGYSLRFPLIYSNLAYHLYSICIT